MNITEYNELWKQLKGGEDIERLAGEGYDRELLLVLYTEKHVRDIKRSYYQVTAKSDRLLDEWRRGRSFDHLASKHRFSPVLMASIVLREHGMTKKEVRNALADYNSVKDRRIRKELERAQECDLVYSTKGYEIQKQRGEEGEARIAKWLDDRAMVYKTEEDLKGSGKTVDFLLDKPIDIDVDGEKKQVNWIESKGSFGDMKKLRRDYTVQLKPYTELWGPGIVVYWFGFLEGMELWLHARDIYPVRKEWFG
ncbi:MAG: TPD domain-containing protein [Candidatus Diapherotrites archaeon]|nr:TPD domain-containing protein [Candidatus Diapherotrites archaeon]